MFESIQQDDAAARARAAGIPPLIAVAVALLYLTLYPLLPRVPALLFWSVVAVLFVGVLWGAVAIVLALRRGAPARWVVVAAGVEALCTWLFASFALPWL